MGSSRVSVITSNWGRVLLNPAPRAATTRSDTENRVVPAVEPRVPQCACGLDAAAAPGDAYNEDAFKYFLEIERKRFSRSGRHFVLILIELNGAPETARHFSAAAGKQLFDALEPCVRETDFFGWYRQGHVAGAVFTQLADAMDASVGRLLTERIRQALRDGLTDDVEKRAELHVHVLPSTSDLS